MMVLVFLLYALFASVFTIQKWGLTGAEPYFFIGFRMVCAGIILGGIAWWRHARRTRFDYSDFIMPILYGFVGIYATNIAEIYGLNRMISAYVCLLYSLSPFLSVAGAHMLLHERITARQLIGIVLGFLGAALPVGIDTGLNPQYVIGQLSWGEVAVLFAVIMSVIGWVLLKKGIRDDGWSVYGMNSIGMMFGGLLALLHSFFAGEAWNPIPVFDVVTMLSSTSLLIVISNLIAYNLYGYLLRSYSATFMSFMGLITPLFAVFLGYVFLGEQVQKTFYVSLMLFFVGLALFYYDELPAHGSTDKR